MVERWFWVSLVESSSLSIPTNCIMQLYGRGLARLNAAAIRPYGGLMAALWRPYGGLITQRRLE